MDEFDFRKKAEEYGYDKATIDDLVTMVLDARKDGVPMRYEDIELIEQPAY